jgi:transcriptional regulator with XRE-family HTH domain
MSDGSTPHHGGEVIVSNETFHDLLKQLRTERGLSQRKLARLVFTDSGHLSRIENGRRPPRADLAKALDDILGAGGRLVALAEMNASRNRRRRTVHLPDVAGSIHGTLTPWASAQMPPDLGSTVESPAWFGLRLAHLIATVDNWRDPAELTDALQELLHQEILMFDSAVPNDPPGIHTVSRRQALMTLAALPVAFATSGSGTLGPTAPTEFFLSRCAASITACWHLLRGSDLNTVDHLLAAYVVPLEAMAQRSSQYQSAAAKLASQAHRVSGIIALHRNQLGLREHHCKQALAFANAAQHPASRVSALISLASTHFYRGEPTRAASLYEEALTHASSVSALQRSRIHAELGVVHGQLQREPDALRALELSQELYPDDPERDPSYLYAEFTRASLSLEQGLTYLSLAEQYPSRGYGENAAAIFGSVETAPVSTVPDRIRYEVNNHQARTAVLLNDLDAFETYVDRGVRGAMMLGSAQRARELRAVWQIAEQRWPTERRLRDIGNQLQLTSGMPEARE